MATKKTAPAKKVSQTGFKTISWLKFLPNISKKRLAVISLCLTIIAYGGFVAMRAINDGYCHDWVFSSRNSITLQSMTVERPENWQKYLCFDHPEENYQSFTLLDYQIPDIARIAWISGFSDGWGMFAPTNAGRIEVAASSVTTRETLDEIEARWLSFKEDGSPVGIETKRFKFEGFNALEIVNYSEPEPAIRPRNSTGRYGYVRDVIIESNSGRYSFRLSNSWHKAESRDAWVAKYEPIFDRLIKSAKFH